MKYLYIRYSSCNSTELLFVQQSGKRNETVLNKNKRSAAEVCPLQIKCDAGFINQKAQRSRAVVSGDKPSGEHSVSPDQHVAQHCEVAMLPIFH